MEDFQMRAEAPPPARTWSRREQLRAAMAFMLARPGEWCLVYHGPLPVAKSVYSSWRDSRAVREAGVVFTSRKQTDGTLKLFGRVPGVATTGGAG